MKLKIFLIFVLAILVFVAINLTGASLHIKNFFFNLSSSSQKILWNAGDGVSDFLAGFFQRGYLQEKMSELESENRRLLGEVVALEESEKENTLLREALGVGLEKEFELDLCQIINKDISQDSLLVDKGSEDGISEGLPVITSQKVLLGRIGEVYGDFSEVVLITNKESVFDAVVSGKDIYGVAKGKGNMGIFLDLVPKEGEITEGDLVTSAALGGIFPKDLLVGRVKEVEKTDVKTFQTAELNPSFNLGSFEEVFIIKIW
jgi:rod shape-determining protein MreC